MSYSEQFFLKERKQLDVKVLYAGTRVVAEKAEHNRLWHLGEYLSFLPTYTRTIHIT